MRLIWLAVVLTVGLTLAPLDREAPSAEKVYQEPLTVCTVDVA